MSHSKRRRARRNKKRRNPNADLFDITDDEDRPRRIYTPDSYWSELQYQTYLRDRMRENMNRKNSKVVLDSGGRMVSLAERIVRFRLGLSLEGIQQMKPDNVHPGEMEKADRLQDLLKQHVQQRQSEKALSSDLLKRINAVKMPLQEENMPKVSMLRRRESQSISLGDSATDINFKMKNRYDTGNNKTEHDSDIKGEKVQSSVKTEHEINEIKFGDRNSDVRDIRVKTKGNDLTIIQGNKFGNVNEDANNRDSKTPQSTNDRNNKNLDPSTKTNTSLEDLSSKAEHENKPDSPLSTHTKALREQKEMHQDENEKESIPFDLVIGHQQGSVRNEEADEIIVHGNAAENVSSVSTNCLSASNKKDVLAVSGGTEGVQVVTSKGRDLSNGNVVEGDDKTCNQSLSEHEMDSSRREHDISHAFKENQEQSIELENCTHNSTIHEDDDTHTDCTLTGFSGDLPRTRTTSSTKHMGKDEDRSKTFIVSSPLTRGRSSIEENKNILHRSSHPQMDKTERITETDGTLPYDGVIKERTEDGFTNPGNSEHCVYSWENNNISVYNLATDEGAKLMNGLTQLHFPTTKGVESMINRKIREEGVISNNIESNSKIVLQFFDQIDSRHRFHQESKPSLYDRINSRRADVAKHNNNNNTFENTPRLSCANTGSLRTPSFETNTNLNVKSKNVSKSESRVSLPHIHPAGFRSLKSVYNACEQRGRERIHNQELRPIDNASNPLNSSRKKRSQRRFTSTAEREKRITDLCRELRDFDILHGNQCDIDDNNSSSSYLKMQKEWGLITMPNNDRKFRHGHHNKSCSPSLLHSSLSQSQHSLQGRSVSKESYQNTRGNRNDFIYLRDVSFCRFVPKSESDKSYENYLYPLLDNGKETMGPFEEEHLRGKKKWDKTRIIALLHQTARVKQTLHLPVKKPR